MLLLPRSKLKDNRINKDADVHVQLDTVVATENGNIAPTDHKNTDDLDKVEYTNTEENIDNYINETAKTILHPHFHLHLHYSYIFLRHAHLVFKAEL